MAAFTTIAAGVGLAATLGSTAMSFSNASKQGKLAAEAKAAADASMQKAKQALEINYQKEQAVKKEPYELEREAALAAGAQAIEAGVESGQAAPTAGRVMLAQQAQQADIQGRMGQEMTAIDKSIINESSRLRDVGVQIDMEEAAGAEKAARDAEEAKALATQQGMEGVTSAIGQAAAFVPLFGKKTADMSALVTPAQPYDITNPQPATQQSYGFGGKNYVPPAPSYNMGATNAKVFGPQPQPQSFNPFQFPK